MKIECTIDELIDLMEDLIEVEKINYDRWDKTLDVETKINWINAEKALYEAGFVKVDQ